MQLHFYTAVTAGKSAVEGQVIRFDSAIYDGAAPPALSSTTLKLRDDVFIEPAGFGDTDLYNTPLLSGVDEYKWSRKATELFSRPNCVHIGLGSSTGYDPYIRQGLYRNLSEYPNTCMPRQSRSLDLATLIRAVSLLRPETLPFDFGRLVGADSQIRHQLMWDAHTGSENMAVRVMEVLRLLSDASTKLVSFAMLHTSPEAIKTFLGFESGAISDLSAITPCFMSHQTIPNERRGGVFMPVAVDTNYPDIIYLADLECDLSVLCDPDLREFHSLVRVKPGQTHLPLIRLNLSRMPFVAPVSVLTAADTGRLKIDSHLMRSNIELIRNARDLVLRLLDEPIMGETRTRADVDYRMLASEYVDSDLAFLRQLHKTPMDHWIGALAAANDNRIFELGRRVLLRSQPEVLSENEQAAWCDYARHKAFGGSSDPERVAYLLKQAENGANLRPAVIGINDVFRRMKRLLG